MPVISSQNAEHYLWSDNCDGWHLAKSQNLSVIQESVPSGCAEIRHYHEHSEQFFYVLSGVATLELDGTTHQLGANQGLHVPALMAHQLSNSNAETLVFIVVSTPPSHGDRISV
jgi:mannose-6-phosphate isomerase-like protein (cupin superfamily)